MTKKITLAAAVHQGLQAAMKVQGLRGAIVQIMVENRQKQLWKLVTVPRQ